MNTRRFATALLPILLAAGTAAAFDRTATAPPAGGVTDGPVRPAVAAPIPNRVDFGYAETMITHHAQAIAMSRDLLARPAIPARVRGVAEFIAHDQQREIDRTNQWLRAWNRPEIDPGHADHQDHRGDGMLTRAQLADLSAAPAARAVPLYLRLMIEHHRGAIAMSRTALAGGTNTMIRSWAKHVVNEQSAENEAMTRLLDDLR